MHHLIINSPKMYWCFFLIVSPGPQERTQNVSHNQKRAMTITPNKIVFLTDQINLFSFLPICQNSVLISGHSVSVILQVQMGHLRDHSSMTSHKEGRGVWKSKNLRDVILEQPLSEQHRNRSLFYAKLPNQNLEIYLSL